MEDQLQVPLLKIILTYRSPESVSFLWKPLTSRITCMVQTFLFFPKKGKRREGGTGKKGRKEGRREGARRKISGALCQLPTRKPIGTTSRKSQATPSGFFVPTIGHSVSLQVKIIIIIIIILKWWSNRVSKCCLAQNKILSEFAITSSDAYFWTHTPMD